MSRGWIGFDLDGTLAKHKDGQGLDTIGKPIQKTVALAQSYIDAGDEVRIFTARVAPPIGHRERLHQEEMISTFCWACFGIYLSITCIKDLQCIRIYDDRAVQVETNTGRIVGDPDDR